MEERVDGQKGKKRLGDCAKKRPTKRCKKDAGRPPRSGAKGAKGSKGAKGKRKTPKYAAKPRKLTEEQRMEVLRRLVRTRHLKERDVYNAETGSSYTGTNKIMLNCAMMLFGWTLPGFLTFNQCKKLGGTIRKGARGVPIAQPGAMMTFGREAAPPPSASGSGSNASSASAGYGVGGGGGGDYNVNAGQQDAFAFQTWQRIFVFSLHDCEGVPEEELAKHVSHRGYVSTPPALVSICADIIATGPGLESMSVPNDDRLQLLLWPAYNKPTFVETEEFIKKLMASRFGEQGGQQEGKEGEAAPAKEGGEESPSVISEWLPERKHFTSATAFYSYVFGKVSELLTKDRRVGAWIIFMLSMRAEVPCTQLEHVLCGFEDILAQPEQRAKMAIAEKLLRIPEK